MGKLGLLSAYLASTKVWLLLLALKELCVVMHICNPSTLAGKEEEVGI